jgi:acyl carrier protein
MSPTSHEIEAWLIDRLGRLTGVPADQIDAREHFRRYGLDSVAIEGLVADLEAWLGHRFRENPLDEHPTIASMAQYLAELPPKGK